MTLANDQKPPADAGRLDLRVVPLVAWRCTWDGEGPFVQYHDLADPMPTKWDDEPPDEVAALVLAIDAGAEIERLHKALGKCSAGWESGTKAIAENLLLRATLRGIVEADWRKWEELAHAEEFVRWAKSRAAHALAGGK